MGNNDLTKPFSSPQQLLCKLESRGMECDEKEALKWLNSVGYYRLVGYWYPYHKITHINGRVKVLDAFVEGSNFFNVANLYEFDRKLRTLIHDGIERIEVGLRAAIVNVLGAQDPLAYENPDYLRENLIDNYKYAYWVDKAASRVRRSLKHNKSIRHHQKKYKGVIPIWVLMEVLDFSDISQLFANMKRKDQVAVAEILGVTFNL